MRGDRIQLRRGTAAFWTDENPILHSGEPGLETDTKLWKIGDGILPWRELPYQGDSSESVPPSLEELEAHIYDVTPHPVYDDGPSLLLLYQNAKV